ncbi:helix-turn-helix domain-containing protein [Spirillospora sp. CA-108201]
MPKTNKTTPPPDDEGDHNGAPGDPIPDDRLLTVMDVAHYLRIGRDSVFGLLRSGELKSVLVRKRGRRVTPEQLRDYITGLQQQEH